MHRGGREKKIRKYLIENNYVDAVIQLPINLLYGTFIPICVLVLKKSKLDSKVLFIDATREFEKSTVMNRLNKRHILKIIDCYKDREAHDYFSFLVDRTEIAKNEYNISVNKYIQRDDTPKIDIAEVKGKIEKTVARQNLLRTQIDTFVSELESSVL